MNVKLKANMKNGRQKTTTRNEKINPDKNPKDKNLRYFASKPNLRINNGLPDKLAKTPASRLHKKICKTTAPKSDERQRTKT